MNIFEILGPSRMAPRPLIDAESTSTPGSPRATARLAFDCSDLIVHFAGSRLPTGIQRVQINVAKCVLADANWGERCSVVFYAPKGGTWHAFSHLDFLSLVNAATRIADVSDEAWTGIRSRLCAPSQGNLFSFGQGDTLINLGTSWWVEDYVLQIRTLKFEKHIRYIPFVHDCIPLVAPEHCPEALNAQFGDGIGGMLRSADGFLVNSRATAGDLERIAAHAGMRAPVVHVIALDGDPRWGVETPSPEAARAQLEQVFDQNAVPVERVRQTGYALCVSTLESRKNHLLLFRVWDAMIASRGLAETPYLFCVGKPGWLFEAALAFLKGRPRLTEKIRFLEGVSDAGLASLYASARFTVYPSFYEGWGLPVTESLCFGKAVACSNTSSLPEAGGDFVDYFDPHALREASEVIDRLAFDEAHRRAREEHIRRSYRARGWPAIAAEALEAIGAIARASVDHRSALPVLELGSLYALVPSHAADAVLSGEDMRLGAGWHHCEEWGAWTRARRAMLRFRLSSPVSGAVALYIQLKGSVGRQVVRLTTAGSPEAYEIALEEDAPKFARMVFAQGLAAGAEQALFIEASRMIDLSQVTEGHDLRSVGCGVMRFGLCAEADLPGRIAMLEAGALVGIAKPVARTAGIAVPASATI